MRGIGGNNRRPDDYSDRLLDAAGKNGIGWKQLFQSVDRTTSARQPSEKSSSFDPVETEALSESEPFDVPYDHVSET